MKRLLFAAAFTLALAGSALADSLPVNLRQSAPIEGETVKLGDLWDNLGAKSETVIANAPQPGKRITADARWLTAVAQAYGVNWQPQSAFDRIVIERIGQVVDLGLVEAELQEALGMEGVPSPFEVEITNRSAMNITIPSSDGPAGVAVRDVVWDERTNRFSATVEVPAGSPSAIRQRINGRVFTVSRLPVLSRAMNRGDVIGENDIQWIDARSENLRRDIVSDPSQLIGKEPRVQVRQGAPIRMADLQRPVLVARNSLVTIALKTPLMTLTTQGRSIDEGGKGDTIHVTNLATKRVVEAIVDGPGMVSVGANGGRMLAN